MTPYPYGNAGRYLNNDTTLTMPREEQQPGHYYCELGNNPRGIFGPDPRDDGGREWLRARRFFFLYGHRQAMYGVCYDSEEADDGDEYGGGLGGWGGVGGGGWGRARMMRPPPGYYYY